MKTRYFELEDDLYIEGRWHLRRLRDNAGIEYDSREFRYGNRIDPGPPLRCGLWNEDKIVNVSPPLRLDWSRDGVPLDFTYTDSCMPVATKRVADVLEQIGGRDIQRFPVRVDHVDEEYEIINVIACIDCLDTQRSDIEWFEEGNDIRPDLAGEPSSVNPLFIDSDRVGDHQIFRVKGWTLPLVVSQRIKDAFKQAHVSGVIFKPVS